MDKSFVSDFIIHMGLGERMLSLIYMHWVEDQPYMWLMEVSNNPS